MCLLAYVLYRTLDRIAKEKSLGMTAQGSHRSRWEGERAIKDFIDVTNETPKPFVWTKTADAILASIARFAQRTLHTQEKY